MLVGFPAVTPGEAVTAVGLLLDIAGVGLLSLSGILGNQPFRTLYHLLRHVDREDVGEMGGGAYQMTGPDVTRSPKNTQEYDYAVRTAGKQSLGIFFLLSGFSLQLLGTLL